MLAKGRRRRRRRTLRVGPFAFAWKIDSKVAQCPQDDFKIKSNSGGVIYLEYALYCALYIIDIKEYVDVYGP